MNRSFTLIEVIVASLLICSFAASFIFLVHAGIKSADSSRQTIKSVLLSKSMLEELRSLPFGMLHMYNNMTFDNNLGRIIVQPAGNDLMSITVKHKVEMSTMRSRY